jgi:hypothetical protein
MLEVIGIFAIGAGIGFGFAAPVFIEHLRRK